MTIKQCFKEILEGDEEQSRAAARRVRKLVYSRDDKSKYDEIRQLVNTAPKAYVMIKEDWRQENFVMAVSVIYFLHDREAEPDFLFSWLFELLQHERGAIRYAAVRMLENEIGPLTVHIRVPEAKYSKYDLTPEKADAILLSMHLSLHQLLGKYDEPKYHRYKYISSLPSSPYKSVQMVLGRMDDDCGEGYLERLVQKFQQQAAHPVPSKQEVKKMQDELELQMAQLLEAANSEWTVDDVKEAIYAERDQDNFTELLSMFDTGEGAVELSDAIEVLTDAWNYFPHHALGGQAPVEVAVADFTMDRPDGSK
jgi:hypothetical protein